MEEMIKLGANVNSKNVNGETPIFAAIFNEAIRALLLEKLIEHGADVKRYFCSRREYFALRCSIWDRFVVFLFFFFCFFFFFFFFLLTICFGCSADLVNTILDLRLLD